MGLDKTKVSFVLPVYNSEKFLENCIESILNQTYSNFEVVAINDGSTDNSSEILKSYSDRILIVNQENQGLFYAIKNGIKEIKGEWIRWVSPDDVFYSESTELLVNASKKIGKRAIIYSNWDLIDENGSILRQFSESNYNKLGVFEYNLRLLDGQQINVNTALIPASLIHEGCNFQNLKDPVAIDYDFFLRAGILFQTKFYLLESSLTGYRISSNQLSHKNISATLEYLNEIRKDVLSQLKPEEKRTYENGYKEYVKLKPIRKKIMQKGLALTSKTIPNNITDKLLVFYLNKIRTSR